MNNTGIVRKIDNLGRIVIPKEIRNLLNIKNGENLEIIVNNDEITLKKFYKLKKDINNIVNYLKIFDNLIDSNFIITDRDKILASSSKEMAIDSTLCKEIQQILDERKQVVENSLTRLEVSNNVIIESYYIISPIIINTDLMGSIICYKNSSIKDVDVLSTVLLNNLIKENYSF